jgi:hypothetical protein
MSKDWKTVSGVYEQDYARNFKSKLVNACVYRRKEFFSLE